MPGIKLQNFTAYFWICNDLNQMKSWDFLCFLYCQGFVLEMSLYLFFFQLLPIWCVLYKKPLSKHAEVLLKVENDYIPNQIFSLEIPACYESISDIFFFSFLYFSMCLPVVWTKRTDLFFSTVCWHAISDAIWFKSLMALKIKAEALQEMTTCWDCNT